jgi:hypothetical protein
MGFNFTYDKILYDRLRASNAEDVRSYLKADLNYQNRSVHFIENHDEERAVTAFGRDRSFAAGAIAATVPGLRFFHEGQLEGRKIRLPIQLIRAPREDVDPSVQKFYDRLLDYCNDSTLHDGQWCPLEILPASEGDTSFKNILAWLWQNKKQAKIIAVNYSPNPSRGRLKIFSATESSKDIALEPWGVQLGA